MNSWRIPGARRIDVDLRVPGDKSITHRALLFAHMSSTPVRIEAPLDAEDTRRTFAAIEALGSEIQEADGAWTVVPGSASTADGDIDCGNSGTTMRLLAGMLAAGAGRWSLTGDRSLLGRPMGRVVDPLRAMGARIEGREGGALAPLHIEGRVLESGIVHELPVASAQVKSAILLAALRSGVSVSIREPGPSRDHTERMLEACGRGVTSEGGFLRLQGIPGPLTMPSAVRVPGDLSSAAFWMVGAAVTGGTATVRDVGLNPTRTGVIDVLKSAGVSVEIEHLRIEAGETVGDVRVSRSQGGLVPFEVHGDRLVRCIDEIPVLGVLAALAPGRSVFADAAELRVKESDRIHATVKGLQAFGVVAHETPDGFVVEGGGPVSAATVDSGGDHRMAMSLAILAHAARGESRIKGAEVAAVSYPGFADVLSLSTEVQGEREVV